MLKHAGEATGTTEVAWRTYPVAGGRMQLLLWASEITAATRDALQGWINHAGLKPKDFLFPSRLHESPHLGNRQYARILGHWVDGLGLDRAEYGTNSMRRTITRRERSPNPRDSQQR